MGDSDLNILNPNTINMGGMHWEWGEYKLNLNEKDSKKFQPLII